VGLRGVQIAECRLSAFCRPNGRIDIVKREKHQNCRSPREGYLGFEPAGSFVPSQVH
jgi:hypothetical protein